MGEAPQAKAIDVYAVKKMLKDCPKEVQNYVKKLEESLEITQQTTSKAITKIKELTKLKERKTK